MRLSVAAVLVFVSSVALGQPVFNNPPSSGSGDSGKYAGASVASGPALTALALDANGANCSSGQAPLGVDTAGASESCWTPVSGPASSTDGAICRYDSTTGKLLKDSVITVADTTGSIVKGAS